MGQGFLVIGTSKSHSDVPHSVGLLWTSDQTDAENSTWQHTHSQETNIHPPTSGGIRTRNPIKRTAQTPRRRPRNHWYRQGMVNSILSTRINHAYSCDVMSILLISSVNSTFITQPEVRILAVCIWNRVTYLNTYIKCFSTQGSYRNRGWPSLCQTVVSSSKNSGFLPRISYIPPCLRTCLRVSL